MKVSVIIPFFKNVSWLEEAIDSVLNQTIQDYEIIVVNDGSLEPLENFITKYGDKIRYYKTENKGPAHARNFGINKSKGEFLAFLDSDDVWLPTKLEKQLKFMMENNSVWSHTNYFTFDDISKTSLKFYELADFSGNIFPQSLAATHIATPSVILKKEILLKNDLFFQEKMRFGQDYYLWLKLSQKFRLDLVPEYLLKVRVRGENAAMRARAHIQVRGQIWDLLKDDSIFYENGTFILIRSLYRMCSFQNKILKFLDRKLKLSTIELISKIIYLIPYIGFKILFYFSK